MMMLVMMIAKGNLEVMFFDLNLKDVRIKIYPTMTVKINLLWSAG